MPLRVYDTLKQKKADFVPLNAGKVGMYVCGMTVQDKPHMGHMLAFVSGDMIRRYLEYLGFDVAYVFQDAHLLPWRTIAHNVRAPLEINHVARAAADRRVAELLEIVGLSAFARSYPSQVSGGMRKRAALARLLAYDPETLLLDEPFVALDAQLRLVMQAELRSLCRRLGKTALFVTHDVDEAAALGDRCIIFTARPGRIRKIVDIGLPRDRDVLRLRHDPRYSAISASLSMIPG